MVRNQAAEQAGEAAGGRIGGYHRGVRGVARHTDFRRRTIQLRSGETTSLDLLHACWANLDAVNPQVNAVIWQEREAAEASARAADEAVRDKKPLGPLHGVPMAHKDMYYQAGKLSTCGSVLRKDFRPTVTATVIDRLSAAGAYTFAGLNMAEFAQNPTGHNKTFGDCHNPWNLPYVTGGSSSGSGASVAARFNYMALGSDTGGSIRIPASACGVTGLKPTQTRVSRYGVMPLSFSHDNVGPLARTARDCARVLTVIAGHDPLDPTSAREPVPSYEAAMDGDLRGVRIGCRRTCSSTGRMNRLSRQWKRRCWCWRGAVPPSAASICR